MEPFKVQIPEGGGDGQSHTIDATKSRKGKCTEDLEYSELQLEKEVEWFSRTLNKTHWENALEIFAELQKNKSFNQTGRLLVHTFELYDKAFSFPRVRKYKETQDNMDMLEHFEDNLNMNAENKRHLANFLKVAQQVRKNFKTKFGDGVFTDPADEDPYEEKDADWTNTTIDFDY